MITAKVGRRGQITIPKDVRERLGLKEGHRVGFAELDGKTVLIPLTETLLDHQGSVAVEASQDFEEIRRQVKEKRAEERSHSGSDCEEAEHGS